eukprot:4205378-Prymnesium_polylepis.3
MLAACAAGLASVPLCTSTSWCCCCATGGARSLLASGSTCAGRGSPCKPGSAPAVGTVKQADGVSSSSNAPLVMTRPDSIMKTGCLIKLDGHVPYGSAPTFKAV